MNSTTAGSSALALLLAVATAAAQPTPNSAAATAQFDQGRALMKDKKYAEACIAFERSQKLEPAPGTLYNLATCYEKIGKLATAWAAYRDLAGRDPNKQRRKAANDQATALAKRLPKLVIEVDTPPAGLAVTLDGMDVTNLLGVETPMDLGSHTVKARAPRHAEAVKTVKITDEGKRYAVNIVLAGEGEAPIQKDPVTPRQPDREPDPEPDPSTAPTGPVGPVDAPDGPKSSRKRNGILLAGTGGLLVVGGALVGQLAGSKWDDARALCGEDLRCDNAAMLEQGNQLVSDARLRANIATGLFVGGVIAAGIGTYLIISAPSKQEQRTVRVTPSVSPALAGVLVEGNF